MNSHPTLSTNSFTVSHCAGPNVEFVKLPDANERKCDTVSRGSVTQSEEESVTQSTERSVLVFIINSH